MAEAETGKYTKRNVLGGLITACVGGLFLGISAYDLVEWSAITNDIGVEPCQGCEPLDKVAMDSAIRSGDIWRDINLSWTVLFHLRDEAAIAQVTLTCQLARSSSLSTRP